MLSKSASAVCGILLWSAVLVSANANFDELARSKLVTELVGRAQAQEGKPELHLPRQIVNRDGTFAPYSVPCPSGVTWVRPANGLGSGEQNYLSQRKSYLNQAINAQTAAHGIPTPPRTPIIGFALSGGGYRAMMVGSGGVMATMNQSSEAAASGIGGWFEGVSYQAGLSGGSWATGSFVANGGVLPTDLVNQSALEEVGFSDRVLFENPVFSTGGQVWNLQSNLIYPSEDQVAFYTDLVSEVNAKAATGFPVQITDYWGLALGDHLLPTQYRLNTSPNFTFAEVLSNVSAVTNASLPYPIIIAAEREPNEVVIAENATVWELTPYEFGSWAFGSQTKVPGAFTPIEYLGSGVNNGQSNGSCWKGFDQLSFVMGTSSTLFNAGLLALNNTNNTSILINAINSVLGVIGENQNDIALYPNSFANWTAQPNPISNFTYITLVDAGETNQNIPLEPLLIPYRNVDAIIAFDGSADTNFSWPNGTALRTSYERSVALAQNQNVSIRMPPVPSVNGFINGGLNTRPTLFGCDSNGTTPIIVYIPNYPWSYYSNTSTFQLQYDNATATQIVLNGMRTLTLNGTTSTWPKCFACALTDRAFGYTSANRTSECADCFKTWCWDGTDNTTTPTTYEPVVGTAPAFLVQKNLTKPTGTAATGTSTSSTTSSSKSAGERRAWSDNGVGIVSVMAMAVGATLGGGWVLL